jgi:ubiquitin carboxyl-terminal hydrolase 10
MVGEANTKSGETRASGNAADESATNAPTPATIEQPNQDGASAAGSATVDAAPAESAPIPRQPPTSWANLFARASGPADGPNGAAAVAVNGSSNVDSGVIGSTFSKVNTNSLAEAIRSYRVGGAEKNIVFLEPRGLINTGNMCYMNAVLQVLMFCSPFYEFLDQVSKRAVHSFKSDTPLLDAMVMFMHEYKVIKSASSDEHLRKLVRGEEIDRYGEPFTPEFVYEAIRQLSRFASMRVSADFLHVS